MNSILSQLWTGKGPAPASFHEYALRTVLPDRASLNDLKAAAARWKELQDAGAQIAMKLMPRDSFDMPGALHTLMSTMDPANVDTVLACISLHVLETAKRELLGSAFLDFNDPAGAPYVKLNGEYPGLRRDLTEIVGAMVKRGQAEAARIEPIEEARMQEKAQEDLRASGITGRHATPQKSHVLREWADFNGQLERLLLDLRGGRAEDRSEGMQCKWLGRAVDVLLPLANRLTQTTTA